MSILIKGEKMPTGCFGCLLICQRWAGGKWEYKCKVFGESVNVNNDVRPSDCPLVEIPPHGRLIDADKLGYNSIGCWAPDEVRPPQDDTEWLISKYDIDNAPTVIESEEQENDG